MQIDYMQPYLRNAALHHEGSETVITQHDQSRDVNITPLRNREIKPRFVSNGAENI